MEEVTKTLILKRVSTDSNGTCGVLLDDQGPFALTMENPWLENVKNISCIPALSYICKRVQSPKFGDTFEVMGVEGRSHILFHKGNTEEDTQGCILIAEQFGYLNGKVAVLSSKAGFNEFMFKMTGIDAFLLIIDWV